MKLLHCSVSIRNLLFLFQFVLSNRYIVKRHFHQFRPTCFPACSFFFALLHTHTNNTNSTQLIFFFIMGLMIWFLSQRYLYNDLTEMIPWNFIISDSFSLLTSSINWVKTLCQKIWTVASSIVYHFSFNIDRRFYKRFFPLILVRVKWNGYRGNERGRRISSPTITYYSYSLSFSLSLFTIPLLKQFYNDSSRNGHSEMGHFFIVALKFVGKKIVEAFKLMCY